MIEKVVKKFKRVKMIKHELYDIAVSEVRGEASPFDKQRLNANVFSWRDALQQVVDEVDSQITLKTEEFEDQIYFMNKTGSSEDEIEDISNGFNLWKSRARTFKKHVSARLMAVKRMCQDVIEDGESYSIDVEKAMSVVEIAFCLVDADLSEDEDEFESQFTELVKAVSDLRRS